METQGKESVMGEAPKISVIIPVYNTEKYLKKCFSSLFAQSFQDFEIICVDDGSSDGSLRILNEYASRDSRIKVLSQKNAGQSVARNRALSLAMGEFISFVDSDDYISSDFLKSLYEAACENNADISITSYNIIEKGSTMVRYDLDCSLENLFEKKLPRVLNGMCCNKLFRRSFLEKYNIRFPEGIFYEDNLFLIKALFFSDKVIFINSGCYYYIKHSGSTTDTQRDESVLKNNSLEMIKKIVDFCEENKFGQQQRSSVRNFVKKSLIPEEFEEDKAYMASVDILLKRLYQISISDRLFSVTTEYTNFAKRQTITAFGIKFARKIKKTDEQFCKAFFKRKIEPQTILFVELNDSHGEVFPGFVKYVNDLGYGVDFLMLSNEASEFPLAESANNLNISGIFSCNFDTIVHILQNRLINKYDYVFFTSTVIYGANWHNVLDVIKPHHIKNSKIILTEHHIDIMRKNQEAYGGKKCVILPDYKLDVEDVDYVFANPHYFGDFKITPKNDIPVFILAGALEPERRNVKILFDALTSLVDNGNANFRIVVIGRGEMDDIPEKIRPLFEIKGRVDYPTLYSEVNNADFFLPLLDPENPDHDRYIKDGTSGSFQLIYGFAKPCLINKKFAGVHGFDSENSIVYEQNSDLPQAMADAINMSKEEYEKKQTKLKELASDIYKKSLENLRGLLK